MLGSIFETFIVSECFKRFYNAGVNPKLYFWRDQSQNEIDLLIYNGQQAFPIEIKLAQTFNSAFKQIIEKWFAFDGNPAQEGLVIYCGEQPVELDTAVPCIPWFML